MPYKAFFVEDEIVTREGIRDNVDWQGNGFEFCGEAPDGELALPLIHAAQADLLITDIKMRFMDRLELCKIVRERLLLNVAVVIGGTLMAGGRFSLLASVIVEIVIQATTTSMYALGVPSSAVKPSRASSSSSLL